jgi:hypothetical protein
MNDDMSGEYRTIWKENDVICIKIPVMGFWVVMPCKDVVWHAASTFSSTMLRDVNILPQHYRESQPRRPRLEFS